MAPNRIELWGRLVKEPELRTTPAGTALLRLAVDCGSAGDALRLEVVMASEGAREVAARLRAGQELYVQGRLRAAGRAGKPSSGIQSLEVLASEIKPAAS